MLPDTLPKDPVILLSFINTQLRDFYPDLSSMCKALQISKPDLIYKLYGIDYEYDPAVNQFR